MRKLEIDPEGFLVDCPKTASKRSGRDCWIPGGVQCEYLADVDIQPSKIDPDAPRLVIRCKYTEEGV